MGIEEARKMLDDMDAGREKFVRELGGPEVLQWMHEEMRRRHKAREAEQKRQLSVSMTTPASDAPPSVTRRVEVLEAQLKHLTRRLQRRRVI